MYDEKLKGYEGYEEFEDICDVRSFECAQEGRNMDITVEDDEIQDVEFNEVTETDESNIEGQVSLLQEGLISLLLSEK